MTTLCWRSPWPPGGRSGSATPATWRPWKFRPGTPTTIGAGHTTGTAAAIAKPDATAAGTASGDDGAPPAKTTVQEVEAPPPALAVRPAPGEAGTSART